MSIRPFTICFEDAEVDDTKRRLTASKWPDEIAAGVLRCPLVTWEPGAPREARGALVRNLESLAAWLGLGRVDVRLD